jgi:hypothetical protein
MIAASDIEDACVLEVAQSSFGQSRLESQEDILEIVPGSDGWIGPDQEPADEWRHRAVRPARGEPLSPDGSIRPRAPMAAATISAMFTSRRVEAGLVRVPSRFASLIARGQSSSNASLPTTVCLSASSLSVRRDPMTPTQSVSTI